MLLKFYLTPAQLCGIFRIKVPHLRLLHNTTTQILVNCTTFASSIMDTNDYYYTLPQQPAKHHRHTNAGRKSAHRKQSQAAARRNKAATARLLKGELDRPYAKGQFRYVARGEYTSGARKGQLCAIKWPKSSHTRSSDLFKHDLRAARATLTVVDQWNARSIIDQPIQVNIPVVWRLGADMGHLAGVRVLVEPFIKNFQKWNSNTGWTETSSSWGRAMQALSHFSYHVSGGRTLVCDLQGGFYDDHAVLTDPVICSTTQSYGPTDMGAEGISNFFARHKCNEYCRKSWKKPKHSTKYFSAVRSTHMLSMYE